MLEAVLAASGEHGYQRVSVRDVLERSGGNRTGFYASFKDKEDCFEQAYEWAAEALCEQLLEAARGADGWRAGLRAGLWELFAFVNEQPLVAKALLSAVRAAGGRDWEKHEEVFGRLSRAVASASCENSSGQPAPPLTSKLIVGAIEGSVGARLAAGEQACLWELFPELVYFAVLPYFGEEAAWREFDAAVLMRSGGKGG